MYDLYSHTDFVLILIQTKLYLPFNNGEGQRLFKKLVHDRNNQYLAANT